MTKAYKLVSFAFLLTASIALYFYTQRQTSTSSESLSSQEKIPTIAIAQIIEHNTLDTVRAGLLAELAKNGLDEHTAHIVYDNAHGNLATATQIANKYSSLHPKILVALSTQSAQILSSISSDSNVPLVFSAVTDPVAAKLVTEKTKSGRLITGVSDYMDPKPQLEMIQSFIPNLKKLGVINNPAEVNSVSFLKEMESAAESMGIQLIYGPINNTAEATSATTNLFGKVDAIYFPNDNTAMAAVSAIATTALKLKIPVFANDLASVERGVLAALAYDRFAMGQKTGEIVIAILNGKKPQDISIVYDTPSEVVVNEETLNKLNMVLPTSIKSIRKISGTSRS